MKLSGGDKIEAALAEISRGLSRGGVVRVGFLENATYPNGTPVAAVALWQDFGTRTIPPRPFFRNMIANKQGEWPAAMAGVLQANDYDVEKALTIIGHAIAGQLRKSILDTNSPPLADSTIARKGFSKPLVETSHMINSVDSEVVLS